MKVIIFDKFWTISDTKKYSNYIFIFGDNDIRKGKGGQAIIRDMPNAIGIPTKKIPSNKISSFYTDDEYEENKIKIRNAVFRILKALKSGKYNGIILPKDGLGTGLAKLREKAPKTNIYLNKIINCLIKVVKNL